MYVLIRKKSSDDKQYISCRVVTKTTQISILYLTVLTNSTGPPGSLTELPCSTKMYSELNFNI